MVLGFAHPKIESPKAMVSLGKYILLNGVLPLDEIQNLSTTQFSKSVETVVNYR